MHSRPGSLTNFCGLSRIVARKTPRLTGRGVCFSLNPSACSPRGRARPARFSTRRVRAPARLREMGDYGFTVNDSPQAPKPKKP